MGRFPRFIGKGGYADRICASALVYLSAVLEYLIAEVLELGGNIAYKNKKKRINPRQILLTVRIDEELNELLGSVTVPGIVVLPNIHQVLIPKKR